MQTKIIHTLGGLDSHEWNALVDPDTPFMRFEFLNAMEQSGCVARESNWEPSYHLLYENENLIGAVALYKKTDSYGEYIFDHAWAEAYHRAGLHYYPKSLIAAPFTPANGKRILAHPDYDLSKVALPLLKSIESEARQKSRSSIHILFLSLEEKNELEKLGYATRISVQFHWFNYNYHDFDGFLNDLRASKRKQIRKERKIVKEQGIQIKTFQGPEITHALMDTMYSFYIDTGQRKWGQPYLNRGCFDQLHSHFNEKIVLAMAYKNDVIIAGTLNLMGGQKLFGRYWGAQAYYPCLHFELCYYTLIEYAIAHDLLVFEAGAQGEHKFLRGFQAVECYSSHKMLSEQAHGSIQNFLETEREQMRQIIRGYNKQSPLKTVYKQMNDDFVNNGQ